MQPDFTPLSMAIAAVLEFGERPQVSDLVMAETLATLDFTFWRACRAEDPREIWYPLEESFREFEAKGPVRVWADTVAPIPSGVIKYWLLGRHAFNDWRSSSPYLPGTGSPPILQ